jgi:hypothetical protein
LLDAHQLAHARPSGSSADIIAGQILSFAPEPSLGCPETRAPRRSSVGPKTEGLMSNETIIARAADALVAGALESAIAFIERVLECLDVLRLHPEVQLHPDAGVRG